ncbi:MAG: hypothetical protein V3V97_05945, partial [Hyphomicrobiaceae bacterium]
CLRETEGKTEISAKNVKAAEREYSRVRYQALCQEWSSTFASLPIIVKCVAGSVHGKKFENISVKEVWELLVLCLLDEEGFERDSIWQLASQVAGDSSAAQILNFARETLALLYRVGVISIKTSADNRYQLSDRDSPIVNPDSIENETKFRLHPMLEREFGAQQMKTAA